MSTLATADLGPSDDEGDTDFALPTKPMLTTKRPRGARNADDSDASYDSDDDDEGEEEDDALKRLKAEAAEAEAAERKKRAAEAFRLMQQEDKRGPAASPAEEKEEQVDMVQVRIPRRFAGETVFETVTLPKDHPDAIKYGAAKEGATEPAETGTPTSASSSTPTPTPAPPTDITPSARTAPGPPLRRPVRKRPRHSLEAMAAAIDSGKKLTTLEKSQMDWNSHMSTETKLAAEVAQHRRSGGFLEKQAFLDRVGERKDARAPGSGAAPGGRRR